mmetsp:Transcript_13809/g.21757  ORF Transcript_13809/g.21757 Transcript_13809/m.21757 type:complete len:238 (+) Transcript_13809:355-1068(+)
MAVPRHVHRVQRHLHHRSHHQSGMLRPHERRRDSPRTRSRIHPLPRGNQRTLPLRDERRELGTSHRRHLRTRVVARGRETVVGGAPQVPVAGSSRYAAHHVPGSSGTTRQGSREAFHDRGCLQGSRRGRRSVLDRVSHREGNRQSRVQGHRTVDRRLLGRDEEARATQRGKNELPRGGRRGREFGRDDARSVQGRGQAAHRGVHLRRRGGRGCGGPAVGAVGGSDEWREGRLCESAG